ncbi:MAG: sulfatase-like hydrolase/transferase [Lentisphaerae bacterium]|nr:sulfatase-like hydrolase/transferase [Lentisphaerota bacterium]
MAPSGFFERSCIDFLKLDRKTPFFLVASFDNPHNICEWARNQSLPWGNIPEPDSIDDCPNLPANFGVPPFEPACLRLEQKANTTGYPVLGFTPERWRRQRWGYFRLIEKVDSEIGRVLDYLYKSGLKDNTVVIFSSDHGDCNGSHSWNQKTVLYEESVNVPLIISSPKMAGAGRVIEDSLVSIGLDLLPTVCDYAGVDLPDSYAGISLRPQVEGKIGCAGHDQLVVETLFEKYNTAGRALITSRYKYCVYSWGDYREQLFDLENDPGEQVNLAVEKKYHNKLLKMRELLFKELEITNDNFSLILRPQVSNIPGFEYLHDDTAKA